MHASTTPRATAGKPRSSGPLRRPGASPEAHLRRITAQVLDELKRPGSIPSEVVLSALAQAWALGSGLPPQAPRNKTSPR